MTSVVSNWKFSRLTAFSVGIGLQNTQKSMKQQKARLFIPSLKQRCQTF